jgi:SlyX protein
VSNTGMNPLPDADKRLTDLEIKASFAEDLLDQLNLIIVHQQQDITTLRHEVALLKHQAQERGSDLPHHATVEMPPHY